MSAEREIVTRLGRYGDIWLFLRAFLMSMRIYSSPDHVFLRLADPKRRGRKEKKDKILKYVALCFRIRRFLGSKDTCFTRSVLLCSLLRQSGLDARINFASKKQNETMLGHCWVTVGAEQIVTDFKTVFKYP